MKGYRTIAINAAVIAVPAVVEVMQFLNVFDWHSILPPDYAPIVIMFVGVANILLRFVTNTKVGKKC